jgi:hypothetical protein
MEDLLELYAEPYDKRHPVVCFDERPYQMVKETRMPLPAKPGCSLYRCQAVQNYSRYKTKTALYPHLSGGGF